MTLRIIDIIFRVSIAILLGVLIISGIELVMLTTGKAKRPYANGIFDWEYAEATVLDSSTSGMEFYCNRIDTISGTASYYDEYVSNSVRLQDDDGPDVVVYAYFGPEGLDPKFMGQRVMVNGDVNYVNGEVWIGWPHGPFAELNMLGTVDMSEHIHEPREE